MFLPTDGEARLAFEEIVERFIAAEGQLVLGWRDVPVDNSMLSEGVRATEPVVRQVRFDGLHARVYGASAPDEDAETVTFRVIAEIAVPKLELPLIEAGDGDPSAASIGARELYDFEAGGFVRCTLYDRSRLRAGDRIEGAAVIQQFDSTTVLLSGQSATVEAHGNLVIDAGDPS